MALHYRKFVYNILTFLLTLTLIMGVSIFTYGTFYFAYMPTEVHTPLSDNDGIRCCRGSRGGDQLPVLAM